ncbi:hypothetical protein AAFF_G00134540 [Aldrovandia affinis]|uniref:Uncharacterized protein n=1 Tax=Aldrovandia affinis TaxID=143900 RepID=A0AAD7RQC8_9TELE|nr:hypothetical protein AAFF_G00134540 [Aldrovandia affinis]
MEFPGLEKGPPFHYMLRASGQGEVWQDPGDDAKFRQYGWRCSTSEDAYSAGTLIGNWSEERSDIRHSCQRRPLPSQFSHYFETTYSSTYNRQEERPYTSSFKRAAHSFPWHQPELDPPHSRCFPSSSYRLDFRDHVTSEGHRPSDTQTIPGSHSVACGNRPPKYTQILQSSTGCCGNHRPLLKCLKM